MANVLASLEPKKVWEYFENICSHPHPSKKEHKLAAYLEGWAKEHKFEVQKDKTGNIVIRKPASPGMENRLPIAIQGHIDMVCEKNLDVEIDFDNDPIQPWIDGDWVKAKGTTLGADNGIGVAMGMALMDSDIPHPAFELLCTLDEETGLTGAITLGTDMLKAKILINLDSEEDGAFTIGCAGGINTAGSYKYEADSIPAGHIAYEVGVKGGRGGHSGIEIHDERANAAKLLNRLLFNLTNTCDIRISTFNSGNKHNAIPRDGFSVIMVPAAQENAFLAYMKEYNDILHGEYHTKEPNMLAVAEKTDDPLRVMTKEMQDRLLSSFYAMPHGIFRWSPDIKGLVQTSSNFAIVETRDDEIHVLTSQRSSVESEKIVVAETVAAAMKLGGAKVKMGDGYPAWQPNMDSAILHTAKEVFKKVFNKEAKIEAIHAGLECGLIGEKYPGMDMLSFGPNLEEVHTPNERIQISSTQRCWKLLLEIINNIPVKNA